MPLVRLAVATTVVVALAAVAGCSFWGKPLTPAERAEADSTSLPVYFHGQPPTALAAEQLGVVSGFSCGSGVLSSDAPPDAEKALNALRTNAKAAAATVVLDAHCERTGFLAQYQLTADPTMHAACWPGFMCTGEAMR